MPTELPARSYSYFRRARVLPLLQDLGKVLVIATRVDVEILGVRLVEVELDVRQLPLWRSLFVHRRGILLVYLGTGPLLVDVLVV